ncbi:hypothetical protein AEA09_14785 [Lysinibacillus contaminans]|uniref:Uncharacterized protein n=1 Tax=Lysinibacillus contaminans TaxID=1293441 RepID=A0ABR5JYD0_9BACI|nr:hypothetical protein [Lysinibacillus contaminans]KOS67116.1 hypothetical protein AEA09_14785 [Lysinibacillus contaminans]
MYELPKLQTELSEEGKAIQKRIEERAEPLKNISAYFDEVRKQEEEARAKAEAEEIKNLPPVPLTPEQHIAKLTEAIALLTEKIEGKGE